MNPQPANEADFWRMKYFELLTHTTQVLGQIMGPQLRAQVAAQVAAMQKQHGGPPVAPRNTVETQTP